MIGPVSLAEARRLPTKPASRDFAATRGQAVFADNLVPTAAASPIGVVGVIDESGFAKKGNHSAGVGRQFNGRLGKQDNCQVGVFLVGVTPGGTALLDHQLYLPEDWCEPAKACGDRRQKVPIPKSVSFQTKPQIAAGLICQTMALDAMSLDWITADEAYGQNGEFLDEVERLELRYVVEVPVDTTVWTKDPTPSVPADSGRGRMPTKPSRESVASVAATASSLGPDSWRVLNLGQGAKGPLAYEFAAIRVWAVRHGEAASGRNCTAPSIFLWTLRFNIC
jgi:SRSO17 transposase